METEGVHRATEGHVGNSGYGEHTQHSDRKVQTWAGEGPRDRDIGPNKEEVTHKQTQGREGHGDPTGA